MAKVTDNPQVLQDLNTRLNDFHLRLVAHNDQKKKLAVENDEINRTSSRLWEDAQRFFGAEFHTTSPLLDAVAGLGHWLKEATEDDRRMAYWYVHTCDCKGCQSERVIFGALINEDGSLKIGLS